MTSYGLSGNFRRRSASVSGSVSDQRGAACVGDSRVRERHAARDPSFRVPLTNSLTLTPTRPATRDLACRAAPILPTGSR
jgi:hypothetical protein